MGGDDSFAILASLLSSEHAFAHARWDDEGYIYIQLRTHPPPCTCLSTLAPSPLYLIQVNIPDATRQAIRAEIEADSITTSTLDPAQQAIYKVVEKDGLSACATCEEAIVLRGNEVGYMRLSKGVFSFAHTLALSVQHLSSHDPVFLPANLDLALIQLPVKHTHTHSLTHSHANTPPQTPS